MEPKHRMHPIQKIAQNRADLSALIEYLEGVSPEGDWEERRTHERALKKAKRLYHFAEAEFSNATATLSDKELAAIGVRRAA